MGLDICIFKSSPDDSDVQPGFKTIDMDKGLVLEKKKGEDE